MRVVDLDGVMFVPVVDETHGGVTVEMQMTVGEFFEKCCQGFEPEVIEAVPVKWIKQQPIYQTIAVRALIERWREEQEAR